MPQVTTFGTTAAGTVVRRIDLSAGALSVGLLTRGAVLCSVRLAGVAHDLTLGSDRLADYEGAMEYFGAIVGPVANRLAQAQAPVGGVIHRFEANEAGQTTLHSGAAGLHLKHWDLVEASDHSATLALTLPAGEGGFPGNRRISACFTLRDPATLRLDLTATTDAPTLMNLANHSYWNLEGTPAWTGHSLRVAADHYLPTTAALIPTGEVAMVKDTAFDLRHGVVLRPGQPPLDTCFCLSDGPRPLREVLWLTGASGLRMVLSTTEPGLQVYDAQHSSRPGHGLCEGLAIEAQGWPDAPNQPGFPPVTLNPGETYHQITEWQFQQG